MGADVAGSGRVRPVTKSMILEALEKARGED
jgi:hypothetical protein